MIHNICISKNIPLLAADEDFRDNVIQPEFDQQDEEDLFQQPDSVIELNNDTARAKILSTF